MITAIATFTRFLFLGIWDSFHNGPGGLSARKLSAAFAVLAAAYNLQFVDKSNAVEMTMVWLCFALLCLGIITMQNVIELRTGKKADPAPATTTQAP